MSPSPLVVEAAGGVLWRPASIGGDGVEVALVHRPAHDDWSLPKGKLDDGEHPLLGALREIEEETGFVATPGIPLGETRYLLGVRPKRVRYWACRAGSGSFAANNEVDELRWLSVAEALELMPARRDRGILERFATSVRDTRALLVVRHASAGDRDAWHGPDKERPLDERGSKQAVALAAILQAYAVGRAVAADLVRCRATLEPFTAATSVRVDPDPAVTVDSFTANPQAGVAVALALTKGPAAVLSTQRGVIEDLVAGVSEGLGRPASPDDVGPVAKGGMVVLHLADGPSGPVLVACEQLPPAG